MIINGEYFNYARTMKERRKILTMRMTAIPNRVMLSEVQQVHVIIYYVYIHKLYFSLGINKNNYHFFIFQDPKDLAEMIAKVLKMGLEGLVLKDINVLFLLLLLFKIDSTEK